MNCWKPLVYTLVPWAVVKHISLSSSDSLFMSHYAMYQSSSWEADRSPAGQWIPWFSWNLILITLFRRACHGILFWSREIYSTCHKNFFQIILIFSYQLYVGLRSELIIPIFQLKCCMGFSCPSYVLHPIASVLFRMFLYAQ
jgi:hypothetical protein